MHKQKLLRHAAHSELPKSVGIIYSEVKAAYFPTHAQYETEKGAKIDAEIIAGYIKKLGIKPLLYPATPTLPQRLRHDKPDVILNLVGSVKGNEYLAAAIPGVLELLEIPYTGTDMFGESLAYNKFLVKKLLEQNGIPVPRYQLFNTPTDLLDPTLRFPLISKLNEIHGAVEITTDAVSENERHLRERLKFMITTYKQPVLIEEFIAGREITCFLLEGQNKKVYMSENIFTQTVGKYSFATFEQQWEHTHHETIQNRKYDDPLLREYVKKAFEVMRMSDYGKFDVRLDSSGRYFFIDSNSNPYFGPKEVDAPISYILEMYGVAFTDILKRLLLNTVRDAEGKKLLPITNQE
jgi:D-alanine-D-alanine ligase